MFHVLARKMCFEMSSIFGWVKREEPADGLYIGTG